MSNPLPPLPRSRTSGPSKPSARGGAGRSTSLPAARYWNKG